MILVAIAFSARFRSAALDVGAEPEQRIFGGDQLAAGLVELLLLALHEPAVRCDGLVDPGGGLLQLQVDLAGEDVLEMGPELVDRAARSRAWPAAASGE